MSTLRRENRGRNAAEANRRALIAAARDVFAEQGINAPLSAVARRANVGQGSLYRHFPDRVGLALAVFEDNVAELEVLAAGPAGTLDACLRLIADQIIESVAFVDMITAAEQDDRIDAVSVRVRHALTGPLREARRAGSVRRSLTADEVVLAIAMVAALVAKTAPDDRVGTARSCWSLVRRSMKA